MLGHSSCQSQPPLAWGIGQTKHALDDLGQLALLQRNRRACLCIGRGNPKQSWDIWVPFEKGSLHICRNQSPSFMKCSNNEKEMLSISRACWRISSQLTFKIGSVLETRHYHAGRRFHRQRMRSWSQTIILVCADKPWNKDSVQLLLLGQLIVNSPAFLHGQDLYGIVVYIGIPTLHCSFAP